MNKLDDFAKFLGCENGDELMEFTETIDEIPGVYFTPLTPEKWAAWRNPEPEDVVYGESRWAYSPVKFVLDGKEGFMILCPSCLRRVMVWEDQITDHHPEEYRNQDFVAWCGRHS